MAGGAYPGWLMSWEDLYVGGLRVALRAFRDDDVPAVEPWYSEAAAAVHGLSDTSIHGPRHLLYQTYAASTQDEGGLLAITRSGENAPIGFLDYRVDVPLDGQLGIYEVALAAAARRRGLGQEAVRLFEGEASPRWNVRQFLVNVDLRNGLALYFWLRLGYRPLDPILFSQGGGVLPMIRNVYAA